eukprot:1027734-Prymnesium_polylepis.2
MIHVLTAWRRGPATSGSGQCSSRLRTPLRFIARRPQATHTDIPGQATNRRGPALRGLQGWGAGYNTWR